METRPFLCFISIDGEPGSYLALCRDLGWGEQTWLFPLPDTRNVEPKQGSTCKTRHLSVNKDRVVRWKTYSRQVERVELGPRCGCYWSDRWGTEYKENFAEEGSTANQWDSHCWKHRSEGCTGTCSMVRGSPVLSLETKSPYRLIPDGSLIQTVIKMNVTGSGVSNIFL